MTKPNRHPFEARLGKWPDERLGVILAKRVQSQLKYFPAQMNMDMAHTIMLAEQGIISDDEARQILGVLHELAEAGVESLPIDTGGTSTRSSLFWYVEATLIDRLGEQVGGKMHTGRSHNDIMPTVSRLTARRELIVLFDALIDLQSSLIEVAKQHVDTVMPGYTALQHGQPWTFGHYLVGWFSAFSRDFVRLQNAYLNTNRSSLGASALAGTSWPLDRNRTCELLGFDEIVVNSRDAGFGTRDYVAEILAAIAIAMSNVNSLCSDLYLWSSFEFGMIELANGFCGTSSFMPQKKNAWAVDWTRGAAAQSIGHLSACLAAMRGGSSTDGTLQDYPEQPLSEAFEVAIDYFNLLSGVIATIDVNTVKMLQRAGENWSTASNLADTIARECHLSFRAAHGIVGRVVTIAIAEKTLPSELTAATVERAADAVGEKAHGLTDAAVRAALDPVEFIQTRVTAGSVNPDEVVRMLKDAGQRLESERQWHTIQKRHLEESKTALEREVARRIA